MIDDLTYNYHGNRLIGVADAGTATGFNELLAGDASEENYESTWEYGYDLNGNMYYDDNKDITNIEYNFLNLPEEVDINSNTTEYIYNAGGGKLRHTDGSGNVTDYIGNAVYEYQEGNTPILSYLISGEGRTLMDGQGPVYEYYMKDHLGNTRVTYTDENTNGIIETSEIDQVNNYYPFGMLHEPRMAGSSNNKYLFGGKELQEQWETYDFGWRQYDPALGRWYAIDRAAEVYYGISPYNYTMSDPVNLIDPNGMWVEGSDDWNYISNKSKNEQEMAMLMAEAESMLNNNKSGKVNTGSEESLEVPTISSDKLNEMTQGGNWYHAGNTGTVKQAIKNGGYLYKGTDYEVKLFWNEEFKTFVFVKKGRHPVLERREIEYEETYLDTRMEPVIRPKSIGVTTFGSNLQSHVQYELSVNTKTHLNKTINGINSLNYISFDGINIWRTPGLSVYYLESALKTEYGSNKVLTLTGYHPIQNTTPHSFVVGVDYHAITGHRNVQFLNTRKIKRIYYEKIWKNNY